jgi:biotin carboxyl carrier protein
MRYSVEKDGNTSVVEVVAAADGTFSISVDGAAPTRWARTRCASGEWRLGPVGSRSWAVSAHVAGDAAFVVHRGVAYQAVLRDPRMLGGAAAAGASVDDIRTPMPGAVARVLVKPGDVVRAGQVLVVVEAMKMENEFKSPRDGTVADVPAATLRAVEAGTVLVRLEPV